MKILYIEHYAGTPELGMEFRPYFLAKEWIANGHKVTIISGDYSHLRNKNPKISKDFEIEHIDGIRYIWVKTGFYQGNGYKRALSMFRFVYKNLRNAKSISKNYKPDIVIASSTYPLDTFVAQRIKKYSGAKYIHEVHDMWPATLYEVGGMSKKHPFVTMMQIAENSAYRNCDKCVSLLPNAKEYMVQHGLKPENFSNIQNGVSLKEWDNTEPIPAEHKAFFEGHKDNFIVGYFGGHAVSNALGQMLDIAKAMQKNKKIIFVLVGDGVEKKKLIDRAKEEKIDNVYFLPPVKKTSVPELLKEFDCSYMTGLPSPLYRFGLCLNKMYDSMMASLPVVCAFDAPDTIIREHNCGIQCDPRNQNEVVDAINKIYNMTPEERKKLGSNGQKAVKQNYTYDMLAKKFLQ